MTLHKSGRDDNFGLPGAYCAQGGLARINQDKAQGERLRPARQIMGRKSKLIAVALMARQGS